MRQRKKLSLALRASEILPRRKKPHHQICRLDDVAAVVVLTERYGSAAVAIHPVRKGAVVALGLIEKAHHRNQAIAGQLVCAIHPRSTPASMAMMPKPRTARRDDMRCRIAPLSREAARRMAKIPEVSERLSLHGSRSSSIDASGRSVPVCLRPMENLGRLSGLTGMRATPRA